MTLKLYDSPGACSLTPHICFEEAGVEVDYVRVDVSKGENLSPEHLELNPNGRAPPLATERRALAPPRRGRASHRLNAGLRARLPGEIGTPPEVALDHFSLTLALVA